MKALDVVARNSDHSTAFTDFVQISATALAAKVYPRAYIERHHRMRDTQYDIEQVDAFLTMMLLTRQALRTSCTDFLGERYMEIRSRWKGRALGQYFTPFPIAKMLARMNFGPVPECGYLTVGEPAAGSGVMLLAVHQVMLEEKLDPRTQMMAHTWDLDTVCAYMCYIQLSLVRLPAVIVCGDSIAQTVKWFLYTPEYLTGGWYERDQAGELEAQVEVQPSPSVPQPTRVERGGQMNLF